MKIISDKLRIAKRQYEEELQRYKDNLKKSARSIIAKETGVLAEKAFDYRGGNVVRVRDCIMFILRERFNFTFDDAGEVVEKDHALVMSAVKKVNNDQKFYIELVDDLEQKLKFEMTKHD